VEPSRNPELRYGYGCGLMLALVVAVAFAFVHGPLVAGLGLAIALPIFHLFYLIVKGLLFPLIERLSHAIGKALRDE